MIAVSVAGFDLQRTGGNCTALVRSLPNGYEAYITSEGDASAPRTDSEPVWLGIYPEGRGEPLREARCENVTEALSVLALWLGSMAQFQTAEEDLKNALSMLAGVDAPIGAFACTREDARRVRDLVRTALAKLERRAHADLDGEELADAVNHDLHPEGDDHDD